MKKNNSAFTLIEVLVVIIIVGIILALAAPNFTKGYSQFQLKKTADDLLNVSRWAQAMAMGQERIYALTFSDDNHAYSLVRAKVIEEGNEETDASDQDTFEPVNGFLGKKHMVPDGVSLDTQEDRIEFYPDGTIDPATIQLNSADQQIELSTSAVRGMMIKVDEDDQGRS